MNPYLRFGPGAEPAAWIALALSLASVILALLRRPSVQIAGRARFGWLLGLAGAAALLSTAYIAYYLRGGPRIVDAAYYFLEGRALSEGFLAFPVPDPLASFNGRFLVSSPDGRLGVLFPPGYPAALAPAFWLGAPLALGPIVAALLVPATYRLGRELELTVPAALGAAAIGVLSAALRYHTADTMSHGFAALLLTSALACAARGSTPALCSAGLCVGWLLATRPLTGAVGAFGVVLLGRPHGWRAAWLAPFVAPGVLLLLFHQHAVTGRWLGSTQLAYYTIADGPPGCFRYGFGTGIGCVFEHGNFVRARLPSGYGFGAALGNTLRRLGVHASDIANAAPLSLLVPTSFWLFRHDRRVSVAFAVIVGVVVAYAPFYFEGSYPGAGARFFADVLPIEHVLIARALVLVGGFRWIWPLTFAGFALHAGQQHALLRDRDGGRPMFEPAVLREAGVKSGLVFVTTDHGFALGHDPQSREARRSVVVARRRNDLLDTLLWESLGRPPTFQYDFAPRARNAKATLRRLAPERWPVNPRLEAEHLWPVIGIQNGWAHPDFSPLACASGGSGMRVHTTDTARLALATPAFPEWRSGRFGWIGTTPPNLRLVSPIRGPNLSWEAGGDGCWRSNLVGIPPEGPPLEVEIEGAGILDYIELSR